MQQEILFTIYSRAEALEILGRSEQKCRLHFEGLLENEYPELSFNWKKIRSEIEKNLQILPEQYEYGGLPEGQFRKELCSFTRALLRTDPHALQPAAEIIERHRLELEYLNELIQARLQARKRELSEFTRDNAIWWRSTLHGNYVPCDAEEHAQELFERREYKKAEAIFRLLIDCFADYAEGHNYLGLIAYEQDELENARLHFEKTIEVGRKLFPARLAKKWYWRDHKTRPYMRGLRNLIVTLNEMGHYAEALKLCERLVQE